MFISPIRAVDPALHFHADIFSTSPNHQTVPSSHIARFLDLDPRHYPFALKPGGAGILASNVGVNLPANGVQGVVVSPAATPNGMELSKIHRNESFFWIMGTMEYCMRSGVLRCNHFIIRYDPEIDDFFPMENDDCTGTIPPASPNEVMNPPDTQWLVPLPRCEQPQEHPD